MSTTKQGRASWDDIRTQIETLPKGRAIRIPRGGVPHPRDAGARPTITWPAGQIADYALEGKPGEAPVVVREFDDHFEAFVDGIWVIADATETGARSPAAAMYLGGALLGGAIGTSVSSKREGVMVGAALGLLFAALVDATLDNGGRHRR